MEEEMFQVISRAVSELLVSYKHCDTKKILLKSVSSTFLNFEALQEFVETSITDTFNNLTEMEQENLTYTTQFLVNVLVACMEDIENHAVLAELEPTSEVMH